MTTLLNLDTNRNVMDTYADKQPYLQIIEQPIDTFRFRYKTEIKSERLGNHSTHGSLTGINTGTGTKKNKRTYPTCQLMNFTGVAKIRCSLHQVDTLNLLLHSHNLVVGKDNVNSKYHIDIDVSPVEGYKAEFLGMGIINTRKKEMIDELREKLEDRIKFEKGRDITEREYQQLRIQAESYAKNMDLKRVCLCFEAFQFVQGSWVSLCEPVMSNPINNNKCPECNDLNITRLSTNISEANGGEDLILLVEKVSKKNIKVRFFETDENDEPVWEDWGRFSETDVHHQFAIALQTPPYKDKDIEETVDCFIQLVRPSDECSSKPKPFRYKPSRTTQSRKRARVCTPHSSLELPLMLDEVQTISKEYNKSGIIAEVTNQTKDFHHENVDSFENFLKSLPSTCNMDELETLIDPVELFELKEISKELESIAQGSMLKTDLAIPSDAKESASQFGEELLIPLRQILRHSSDIAAEKIRSLFASQYENNRFILDFLVTYNPSIFKHFLTFVEKFGIADVLDYQNDRKKSCFHIVCENCWAETILDIVPILIRLGADPNFTDDKGDAVLHVLIRDESLTKCVDLFLKSTYPKNIKLNLEIQNYNGLTPLLLATRLNRIEVVQSLLNAGASSEGVYSSKDGNNIAGNTNSEDLIARRLDQTIHMTGINSTNEIPIELGTARPSQNRKILDLFHIKHDQVRESDYTIDASCECEYCSLDDLMVEMN